MQYVNICERYGGKEKATLADYKELNPTGQFIQDSQGIYETVNGVQEKVATPVLYAVKLRPEQDSFLAQVDLVLMRNGKLYKSPAGEFWAVLQSLANVAVSALKQELTEVPANWEPIEPNELFNQYQGFLTNMQDESNHFVSIHNE